MFRRALQRAIQRFAATNAPISAKINHECPHQFIQKLPKTYRNRQKFQTYPHIFLSGGLLGWLDMKNEGSKNEDVEEEASPELLNTIRLGILAVQVRIFLFMSEKCHLYYLNVENKKILCKDSLNEVKFLLSSELH